MIYVLSYVDLKWLILIFASLSCGGMGIGIGMLFTWIDCYAVET
jgi:hypothetical protein